MDLSEVLLYLELMKKNKKNPSPPEMNLMLHFLKDYEEVKVFYGRFTELGLKMPKNYEANTLIHFIEDIEDTYKLKEIIITKRDRRVKYYFNSLFIHQILLSKTSEQAVQIWNEAKECGVDLSEVWVDRYDSQWRIKQNLEEWRKSELSYNFQYLQEMYEEFCEMKNDYFAELSLPQLKQKLLKNEVVVGDTRNEIKTIVFSRSVLIKEFARRVAKGICQLCEKEAPFLDKLGKPFLEVHHIHYLSKGGSDTIDNVVAVCPNCHRRIHHLELEKDNKKILEKALVNINV
ncbi:HNH endonuclease [Neobacillus drentensis]|uniref:HNH endonuclease n=1 Tax=Neobacillus drentensis TaxID=220684 RepID=UPI002FFE7E28